MSAAPSVFSHLLAPSGFSSLLVQWAFSNLLAPSAFSHLLAPMCLCHWLIREAKNGNKVQSRDTSEHAGEHKLTYKLHITTVSAFDFSFHKTQSMNINGGRKMAPVIILARVEAQLHSLASYSTSSASQQCLVKGVCFITS